MGRRHRASVTICDSSPTPLQASQRTTTDNVIPTSSHSAAPLPTPSMDWSTVERGKKRKSTSKVSLSSSTSIASSGTSHAVSYKTPTTTPNTSIFIIHGLPSKYLTAKALSGLLTQIGVNVVDLRIGRNSASVKSNDIDASKKLATLKSIVDANISVKSPSNLSSADTSPNLQRSPNHRLPSYSCVLRGVELDISPEEVDLHLRSAKLHPLKVWRIKSRATGNDTTLVRVLTREEATVDYLLSHGLYMFHRRYHAEPSHPSLPQAIQCRRCQKFGHSMDECRESIKCGLCSGSHPTYKCDPSKQKPKCVNCGEAHPSLKFKCPARPKHAETFQQSVPLKCVDKPAPTSVPDTKLSVENVIRFTTTALLNLLPDRRPQIAATVGKLANQYFGKSIAVSYDGNTIHISVNPITYANVAR